MDAVHYKEQSGERLFGYPELPDTVTPLRIYRELDSGMTIAAGTMR
jgi:hypothetical protein